MGNEVSIEETRDTPSPELIRRSVDMILRQSREGAVTAVLMGALFGLLYVPAAGWLLYLGWYLPFAALMIGRQPYFQRLVAREGPTPQILSRVAGIAAFSGWLAPASVPIFSRYLTIADVGVLTIITVGWVSVAVSVLAVRPRIYAMYLAACFATVYLAWFRHAGPLELGMIGVGMVLGGRMMVKLGQVVWSHMRETVTAAEQNASLVQRLRDSLEQQQQAQLARSRFLGAASHDLRQPVQALMFLSDIFRRSTDPGRRDAMAQQIVRTGESIDSMFRHLVDFAQIDAGTMKAVMRPVQLDQLVTASVSGFAEKCAARGLRFRLELQDACPVMADPVLLERMLRNFLDNAYKYSLEGEIELRAGRDGDSVLVSVRDQGVGMEERDLAQACNAFFRGRSAALAEAEGIGLGLAISRHMADLMQAQLHMSSSPGAGSQVTLRLHCAPASASVAPPRVFDTSPLPLAGWLVAVLESDRQARLALCAWLEEAGARVAHGATLAEVQKALHAQPSAPDFIVSDFQLGDETGLAAIEALRSAHGDVPALIISGEPDVAERGLPYPVLQKPVTPGELLDVLREASAQGC